MTSYIITSILSIAVGAFVTFTILKRRPHNIEVKVLKEKEKVKKAQHAVNVLKAKAENVKNEKLTYTINDLCNELDSIQF